MARIVVGLPESVTAAVTGFSIPLMALLLLNHFTPAWTLPLGVSGAVIAVRASGLGSEAVSRASLGWSLGAVGLALAWFWYNVRYSAQDVYAIRDPSTYTITGRWLMDHASLAIHTQPEVYGSPAGASFPIGAYSPVGPGTLNAQGNHLLPAILAVSGSVFGQSALFTTNVAIGALALIVFFGLGRRIVSAPLALLATAILALSMPYIYVSRDTFTEPLTMLFLIGSLALAHRAMTSWRVAEFALCGLAAGSAAMVRIDSDLALLGIVAGAALFLASAPERRRADAAIRCAVLLAGAVLTAVLGWVDLVTLSRQYYDSQRANITMATLAVFLVVLAAPGVVWVLRRPALRAWLRGVQVRRRLAWTAAGGVVAVFAVLASRPLWMQTHGPPNSNLVHMQEYSAVAVDGTRTYDEQTVHWLALYLGWPTVVLGVAGYAAMIVVLVRRRTYALCATLAMGLSMSFFYLWSSKITPDQPWSMRRYVPVVMPLLLVAATYALRALWGSGARARHGVGTPHGRRLGTVMTGVAVLAAAAALALPAAATWPMRHVREDVPQLGQLQALCTAIGPRAAVVMLDESVIVGYGQSVRSFCKVPVIGVVAASGGQLAMINKAVVAHGRRLFVLAQDANEFPATMTRTPSVPVFSVVTVQRWPNQIGSAPKHPVTDGFTELYLVGVDATGTGYPVTPVKSGS
ncbi:MAG: glycosyltransferase family 39 protein [Actinomycetota bacterium]|nr:glycosyltransferase family 39 protein [Actinomycetota bacterium]